MHRHRLQYNYVTRESDNNLPSLFVPMDIHLSHMRLRMPLIDGRLFADLTIS